MKQQEMIAVIADDFTGAAEIGGVGLKYGLDVVIETKFENNVSVDLWIIAADTRSLNASEASEEINTIIKQLKAKNPTHIFKKLDSVLRGNIATEIEAQLEAMGKKRAILIAGNPSFGRTIENGKYMVDAVPLDKTSFSKDPDFPVQSCDVLSIVKTNDLPVYSLPVNAEIPERGIIIGDVKNQTEMEYWKELIDEDTMAAGGAGFFDILLRNKHDEVQTDCRGCLELGDKTLFIFGSKFPKSRNLPMGLKEEETVKLNMPDEIYQNKDFDTEFIKLWAAQVVNELEGGKKVIITVEQDYSSEANLSARIKKNIAVLVKLVSDKTELTDLLIEGGATTSEILRSLDIVKLFPSKLLYPGIIQLKPSKYPGLTITTKPGSYPWPDDVILKKPNHEKLEELE